MTELGNRLKQAREEKGMSLEDLQTATKIQKRYLIGIEEGNYVIMPGQFYARAFIRQYSEAVGLDPDEVFEQYKNDIPNNEKDDMPQLSRVKTRKQVPAKSNKLFNFLPKVLLFLALVAIVAIIYVLVQKWGVGNSSASPEGNNSGVVIDSAQGSEEESPPEEKEEEEEAPPEEEPEETQEEAPPENGTLTEVSKSGQTATLELTETDKFEVEILSNGNTWVGVTNPDGETFLSKELGEGQSESFDFSDQEEITFNIGWVPDTEIKINGEVLEFPFPKDDKTTQKITIKFLPNGEQ
ncbi:Helix-turn-helix domain protein [Bacillus sp. THAF10]|uniref:helix-turn-helix domain-containing protein n=1 Tax=Bacillus sp. THAF10 TaxID=2587848 RepID=UPI0012684558|nr:RodZ domain-containing protein [Bacillus sp. THAF10]QFT88934.1 Helix-turn-helix domain protein [Bacillus sp. THAF10]